LTTCLHRLQMSGDIPYTQHKKKKPMSQTLNIVGVTQTKNASAALRSFQGYESKGFSSDDTNSQNSNNSVTKSKQSTVQFSYKRQNVSAPLAKNPAAFISFKPPSDRSGAHGRGRTKKKKSTKSREHSLENQLSMLSSIVQHEPEEEEEDQLASSTFQQRYTPDSDVDARQRFADSGRQKGPRFENGAKSASSTMNGKLYEAANKYPQQYQQLDEGIDLRSEVTELRKQGMKMEKTLQWWTDCTANWKEKWAKVKNERNRSRDELSKVKVSEMELVNELTVLRQQRQLLIQENKNLKNEVVETRTFSDASSCSSSVHTKRSQESSSEKTKKELILNNSKLDDDELSQKTAALQLKVEESAKTIQAERDAKLSLNKSIEMLEQELSIVRQKHDEVKTAKQETLKQMSRIQESHRSEMVRINESLEEELGNRDQLEKKVQDLREEVERLQGENTCEWGKRERIETDKLQLERDNKRLKSINDELKSAIGRKCKAVTEDRDNELKQAHAQLQEFNEDLINLRRQSTRDQKLLQDRHEELSHSKRRAEQHETEVRALRTRIEELKKQQGTTEDELDNVQNQHRKLLRVVEEKDEELDKLQLQYDHAQTRMRHDARAKTSFLRPSKESETTSDSDS